MLVSSGVSNSVDTDQTTHQNAVVGLGLHGQQSFGYVAISSTSVAFTYLEMGLPLLSESKREKGDFPIMGLEYGGNNTGEQQMALISKTPDAENSRRIEKGVRNGKVVTMLIVFAVVATLSAAAFQVCQTLRYRDLTVPTSPPPPPRPTTTTATGPVNYSAASATRFSNDTGVELSADADCESSSNKQSFPDLDYALLGYNVLKGYPLSTGHDPGFTYSIFTADYSSGMHTADCRYSVPAGMLVIPDVSCELSFTSKIAKTKTEFADSLSVSAKVGGGGWGVEFSASAEYKKSTSEMSLGETVYILSTASCDYYYCEPIKRQLPKFHPLFLDWVKYLSATDDKITYLEFFETFGTHFTKKVTFGARYSFKYKMSSESYQQSEANDIDVAVEASYAGTFSVTGGAGMTSDQKKAAESFLKTVETKIITTGAVPPASGGASAWASTVKENPLPVMYELESMEKLFTEEYMPSMPAINTNKIISNIARYKMDYCMFLKGTGDVNSCSALNPAIELTNTALHHWFERRSPISYTDCVNYCLEDVRCVAIDYCMSCLASSSYYESCFLYGIGKKVISEASHLYQSTIFYEKLSQTFSIFNTAIKGISIRLAKRADRRAKKVKCLKLCLKDSRCAALSYSNSKYRTEPCLLYGANYIYGLRTDTSSVTMFVPFRKRKQALLDLEPERQNDLLLTK